jgi:lipopolysaccharide export system permease protein
MKKTIYKYFFTEFLHYFVVVLFALVSIIWTIQAVNFLDLVTEDGHGFLIYLKYSTLTIPKIFTKLIPFAFLTASMLTILKLEKDNELIILWTSGLNKIHIVNLILRISLIIMIFQFFMSTFITPQSLNFSRTLLKNSQLQFVPSLLKERKFNDTVEGLTIFVEGKNENGIYQNIFIRDDGKVLTQISDGSSSIFARSGYLSKEEKNLVLLNGNIQKVEPNGKINIINFDKTVLNLSGLTTKTISETKIQETTSFQIIECIYERNKLTRNCPRDNSIDENKELIIELNKRFGMPIFLPLISLIACFLLSGRNEKNFSYLNKYLYFSIGLIILILSEITVRYSGLSINNTIIYYAVPILLLPIVYFILIRTFKYENLN